MNMRYFLRRLSVVFVCLSVLFLNTFSAFASTDISDFYVGEDFGIDYPVMSMAEGEADTTKGDYFIRYNFGYGTLSNGIWNRKSFLLSQNVVDNQIQGYENSVTFDKIRDGSSVFNYSWSDQFVIQRVDQTKIAKSGQSLKFSIRGFKQNLLGINASGTIVRNSYMDINGITSLMLYVYGQDAEGIKVLHVDKADISKYVTIDGPYMNIAAEIDGIPVDAYKVNVLITYGGMGSFNNNNGDSSMPNTYWDPSVKLSKVWGYSEDAAVVFKTDDNTSGLLSNIIGFISSILEGVQNIFSKLGDIASSITDSFSSLFTKLGTWFSDLTSSISGFFSSLITKIGNFMTEVANSFTKLFTHITQLPAKVWKVFEDGLKAVFVPDETFITEYKTDWDTLLSERFGVLYQSFNTIVEFVEVLDMATSVSHIEMPEVSIDLEDGEQFTFGGYYIKLVPEGFEFLANAVKFAIDVIVTLGFINAMKNRFDRLMIRG